ncbi:protease [Mucilaginibacter pineti]|nr:protease [Mucilaginibacter pineti]
MKKSILYVAMLALSACGVKTNTTNNAAKSTDSTAVLEAARAAKPLFAKMQIRDTIKTGDSVLLKFTVYNTADSTQHFCKWHTPFEPLMSKYLDVKNEKGEEMNYLGAMAKRIMPPPASSYIKVSSKDSLTSNVDLLKAFAITKPAKYTITYVGQNMSGLVVIDSVSFVYAGR